jgi:hypothetical protein
MKIENLNKENFWNELQQTCPNAMKVFCKWIDQYKESIDWKSLFYNENIDDENGIGYRDIKFHHIPYEMQVGIIFRFLTEAFEHKWWTVEVSTRKNTLNYIRNEFFRLETRLTTAKEEV